jgi:hypothetical protein
MFDSFIIPLIRSNFHVTESSHHRNRLFYFRHDVWRKMTEPALLALKASMLEEMPTSLATSILTRRTLGFSQIRLLPKATGLRPIANLRRRAQSLRGGKTVLGRSINSVLTPVFNVLKYEKVCQSLPIPRKITYSARNTKQKSSGLLFFLYLGCSTSCKITRRIYHQWDCLVPSSTS